MFLLNISRPCFFVDPFLSFLCRGLFLSYCLALWSPAGKGLTSRVSCAVFLVFSHFLICGPMSESNEYDRKYHNHILQTNPRHREEEPHNIYNNNTSVRQ